MRLAADYKHSHTYMSERNYHKELLKLLEDVESGLAGVRPKSLSTSLQC